MAVEALVLFNLADYVESGEASTLEAVEAVTSLGFLLSFFSFFSSSWIMGVSRKPFGGSTGTSRLCGLFFIEEKLPRDVLLSCD